MRLIVNVPDNTNPELMARIHAITERLNLDPEFAAEIPLQSDSTDDASIQRMFTPERLAHIAKSDAEIDAGNFLTGGQVQAQLKEMHAEWIQQHQR